MWEKVRSYYVICGFGFCAAFEELKIQPTDVHMQYQNQIVMFDVEIIQSSKSKADLISGSESSKEDGVLEGQPRILRCPEVGRAGESERLRRWLGR